MIALLTNLALAAGEGECVPYRPDDYDEQQQGDRMQNIAAVQMAASPLHRPIPHRPGRGAVGIVLHGMPDMSCEEKLVLGGTKVQTTQVAPIMPIVASDWSFELGSFVPYVGMRFLPQIPIRIDDGDSDQADDLFFSSYLSTEVGIGRELDSRLQAGVNFQMTSARVVGDMAGKVSEEEEDYYDVYQTTTLGANLMLGFELQEGTRGAGVVPYLSVGVLDASTYFYVGDDGVTVQNKHPAAGVALAAGVDALVADSVRLVGEFYAFPGGYSRPDPTVSSVSGYAAYGDLYTARFRVAWEPKLSGRGR